MAYEIRLEVFEGPLDLLLHLIHKNEVSITDIPIALITRQYLDTIEMMKSLNLDVAGEYLVMAAYLTHVKSRMLLPVDEDPETEDNGEDPRDELVAHLLEYKRYKEVASGLAEVPTLDNEIFTRESPDDADMIPKRIQPLNTGLPELISAFKTLLEKTGRSDLLELEPDRLSIRDKIRDLLEIMKHREWITFGSLFPEDASRMNLVTTFLALLEIVKIQLVRVYQDTSFGTILITRRVSPEDSPETVSIDPYYDRPASFSETAEVAEKTEPKADDKQR